MTKIIIKNYISVLIGCLLYAAGISLFLGPNNLAPGGVSGLSIILDFGVGIFSKGTWIVLINIPIMIIGIIKLGIKIIAPTAIAIGISSVAMDLLSNFIPPVTANPLLACIGGAVLVASGIGLVFRGGATTGGTDIIVKLLRLKFPHISTGTFFLAVDGAICTLSGFVFNDIDKALYAGIALIVQMFVLNTVLYGSDEARMVYIISDKDAEISKHLLTDIGIGITFLNGSGAYTGKDKRILMCVMRMRMLPQARDTVRKIDDNAFMIVTKATGVFGLGFKSHNEADL